MVVPSQRLFFVVTFSCLMKSMCAFSSSTRIEDSLNNCSYSPSSLQLDRSLSRIRRAIVDTSVAYYDFIVNEYSFKIWAVFELVTIGLLFYSTFAAIYYARWTYLRQDPNDDSNDYLLRRSHERLIRALENPPGRRKYSAR